jgi:TPR repeat protein
MGWVKVLLWLFATIPGLSLPAFAETRIALVIGNSAYESKPLTNPIHDADLIARTLRSVGFRVTMVLDATQEAMKSAVLEFGRELRTSDSVGLFYYAGHGVQIDGENYLIPVGANIRDDEEVAISSVSLSELLRTMERASSRLNIAILDACRDNPFATASRAFTRGLAPATAPSGTLIAYATAPGKVALDGENGNSPYTAALAEAMRLAGSPIEDVFRRTRRKVLDVTAGKQTPWEHSSLTGEFYFVPKSAAPEASDRPVAGLDESASRRLAEIADWDRVKTSNDAEKLKAHLERYPDGLFSELAQIKLARLQTVAGSWTPVVNGNIETAALQSPEAIYERALKIEGDGKNAAQLSQAAELYRSAADLGLTASMYALARAYDKGRGVPRDLPEAAKWYRKAADGGHAAAMASLGTMYEYGEGTPLDLAEATRLYRAAADLGDANGLTNLAFLTAEGKGVAQDKKEARRQYELAAEKGQPRAMYNLALMLMRGEGGIPDLVSAVRWLEVAAQKHHPAATRELAYLYDEGRGVARNSRRAAELVLAALQAGDAQAKQDVITRPHTWSYATRREIQRRLYAKGLYTGPAHGFFDSRTRRALTKLAMQN